MKKRFLIIIALFVSATLIVLVSAAFYYRSSEIKSLFYRCPKERYINCMPPLEDDQYKKYCSKEGRDWLTKNCSTKFAF